MFFVKLLALAIVLRLIQQSCQHEMNPSGGPDLRKTSKPQTRMTGNEKETPEKTAGKQRTPEDWTRFSNNKCTKLGNVLQIENTLSNRTKGELLVFKLKRDVFSTLYLTISLVFIVSGILLNIMNLIVCSQLESIMFNVYLKAIAMTNLLYLLCIALFFGIPNTYNNDITVFKLWYYNGRGLITFQYANALIILYIAVQRAVRVHCPLMALTRFTRTNAKITVVIIWLLTCVIVSPHFFLVKHVECIVSEGCKDCVLVG